MNTPLLLKVKARIAAHPTTFEMSTFFGPYHGDYKQSGRRNSVEALSEQLANSQECGTTACIGGWSIILSDDPEVRNFTLGISTSYYAQKALGLTDIQAEELFNVGCWDSEYTNEYDILWGSFTVGEITDVMLAENISELACRYIDHFIAKHED